MAVSVGVNAPEFTLETTEGTLNLRDLRGTKVVLYFYPKDDTPGCTREACDFRDSMKRLEGHGAVVLGVSKDSVDSHGRFRQKYGLPFSLASDPGNVVAKTYGAFGKKMMYGKPVIGTIRSTFLLDEQGTVKNVWSPVKVDGHVDAVLAAIEGKEAPPPPKKKAAAKKAPAKKAAGKVARKPAKKAVKKPAKKKSRR
ncbi:MAG: peroxiredoxin [Deltaproteobacteria bacterium]|nr:peroxiredoxin [Deltaproteobacteria bacterium]